MEETLLAAQSGDILEVDEMWSFVREQWQKCWIWIAMCRRTRQIIAYAIGDRSQMTCQLLWDRIPASYKGCQSFSDLWEVYQLVFPPDTRQCIGKGERQTNHMERWYNLLRQANARFVRQTLSVFKSDTMHEIVTYLLTTIKHSSLSRGRAGDFGSCQEQGEVST
ncbi:MAG: IS1 family transposase [Anaerolineales bacterium]